MKIDNLRGHSAMLTANIIFGLNAPISKSVFSNEYIDAYSLSFFRMAGGAVLFWIASVFAPKEKVELKDLGMLFFASLFGIQLNQIPFLIGLSMTSPIDASIVATMVPILTMLFAALYLKEPITWKKAGGVALGATGAILLITGGNVVRGGANMIGNLICLGSATSFALYLTLFKNLIKKYSPVTVMKWMFLFAAICCYPICYPHVKTIDFASIPTDVYLRLVYVVVGATFITYMLIPIGQKVLRPTLVSSYNYTQPFVASLAAIIMGLDMFGWSKGFAALLIFAGVYLVTISKSREQMEKQRANGKV